MQSTSCTLHSQHQATTKSASGISARVKLSLASRVACAAQQLRDSIDVRTLEQDLQAVVDLRSAKAQLQTTNAAFIK